jgi:hypothetical protein
MYVRNLTGDEFPLQATLTHDMELNGNRTLSSTIKSNKVNDAFIDDLSQMWEIVDDDDVAHKIIYFKKKGEGNRLFVDIKAIPLFFDKFDIDRIYETYNEHMTADRCFSLIFQGSGFNVVILSTFYAVQWEGFGKGNTRLSLFKDAINRYAAEFRISGNTIYLESQIGRDTNFMYRHKLNASNIVMETDASQLWTYAKGFGNYADGEEANAALVREYTSSLAAVIGVRHAPPIYDGRVTDATTMDNALKILVDESLKISVSADIHDLRRQGYALAQPELGDRIFLIDERIKLNEEVRVQNISVTNDWRGNVLDLKVTFGSEGIAKRHQSNLKEAVDKIIEIVEGKTQLPMSVVDPAIIQATKALQSAQTEVEFNNGFILRSKVNPNYVVLVNSAGIGVSTDGGATFRTAMTAEGIVADLITVGTMLFDRLQGGSLRLGSAYQNGVLEVWVDSNSDGDLELVGRVDSGGAYYPLLQGDKIRGDVENIYTGPGGNVYFEVLLGDDNNDGSSWSAPKKNLQAYIDSMPKNLNGKMLVLNVRNDVYGGINLDGFHNGHLYIVANTISGTRRPRLYGQNFIKRCGRGTFSIHSFDANGDDSSNGNPIFKVEQSDYVLFYDMKVYGNSKANHAFSFDNSKFSVQECGIYGVTDRGIYAANLSHGKAINNRGSIPVAILVESGSILTGEGTRPAGSVLRLGNSYLGGNNTDVWAVNTGEETPAIPPEASEKTLNVSATTGDNWGTMYGWADNEVRQGDYGYGTRHGIWYFDLSVLRGKTIISATITLSRNRGGINGQRTVHLRTHPYKNRAGKPAGQPALSAVGATTTMAVGETKTVDITAMIQSNIANFTDNSIGVHTTGSSDYMSLGVTPTLTIRYK